MHLSLAAIGYPWWAVLSCSAVSNCWQYLVHSASMPRLPRLVEAVVTTPSTHRRHHLEADAPNLGAVLTVWDRMAGTWRPGDAPVRGSAVAPETDDRGAVAIELAGWRRLVGH